MYRSPTEKPKSLILLSKIKKVWTGIQLWYQYTVYYIQLWVNWIQYKSESSKYLGQSNCVPIWKSTVLLSIHSKRILLMFKSLEGLNHLVINQGLISHLLSRSSSSANISVEFLGSIKCLVWTNSWWKRRWWFWMSRNSKMVLF